MLGPITAVKPWEWIVVKSDRRPVPGHRRGKTGVDDRPPSRDAGVNRLARGVHAVWEGGHTSDERHPRDPQAGDPHTVIEDRTWILTWLR